MPSLRLLCHRAAQVFVGLCWLVIHVASSPFTTTESLKTAVTAWCGDRVAAESTYGVIESWDVSQITSMTHLFASASCGVELTSYGTVFFYHWDMSSVTSLQSMFEDAQFNSPLDGLNTSNVQNMQNMFKNVVGYDQDIKFSTDSATTVESMFFNAEYSGVLCLDLSNSFTKSSMFNGSPNAECCSGQYRSAAGDTGVCTLCENRNAYTLYKDYRFTVTSTVDSLKRVRINELYFYDENDDKIALATSSCFGCSGQLTDDNESTFETNDAEVPWVISVSFPNAVTVARIDIVKEWPGCGACNAYQSPQDVAWEGLFGGSWDQLTTITGMTWSEVETSQTRSSSSLAAPALTCGAGKYITGTPCLAGSTSDTQTCTDCGNTDTGEYACPAGSYKNGAACDGNGDSDTQTCGECSGHTSYTCNAGSYKNGAACDGNGDSDTQTCGECSGHTSYTCNAGSYKNGAACDGNGDSDTQTCGECSGHTSYTCNAGSYKNGAACDGNGDSDTQTCAACGNFGEVWVDNPGEFVMMYHCASGSTTGVECDGSTTEDTQTCPSVSTRCNGGGGCGSSGSCNEGSEVCECEFPMTGSGCASELLPTTTLASPIEGIPSGGATSITLTGPRLDEFVGGEASWAGATAVVESGGSLSSSVVPAQHATAAAWYTLHKIIVELPNGSPTGYNTLTITPPAQSGRRRLRTARRRILSVDPILISIFVFYECQDGQKSVLAQDSTPANERWRCVACDEGGFCPGGDRVWPVQGWWSLTEKDLPVQCQNKLICPGLDAETITEQLAVLAAQQAAGASQELVVQTALCSPERAGLVCTECAANYYKDGQTCRSCSSSDGDENGGLVLVALAVVFTFAVLLVGLAVFTSANLKEITEWTLLLQDLSFCAAVGSNGLPNNQGFLIKVFSILSIFNFEFRAAEPGCEFPPITLVDEFYGTIVISIVFCLLAVPMSLVHGKIMAWRFQKHLTFLKKRAMKLQAKKDLQERTETRMRAKRRVVAIEKAFADAADHTKPASPGKSSVSETALKGNFTTRLPEVKHTTKYKAASDRGSTVVAVEVSSESDESEDEHEPGDTRGKTIHGEGGRIKYVVWNNKLPLDTYRMTVKRRLFHALLLIGTVMHLQITVLSLKVIVCEEIQLDGGQVQQRVSEDPRFQCYEGPHTAAAAIAWILLLLYSFGFPFLLWNLIRKDLKVKHPHLIKKQSLSSYSFPRNERQKIASNIHWKYDFLFEGFQPKYWYLSVTPFAVNFLMIITEMLADSDQVACFMMGIDFFLEYLVIAILLPKDEDEGNLDDLKVLCTKKMTVAFGFMALAVFVQQAEEDLSVSAEDGEAEQPNESSLFLGLFYLLLAMYVATLAYLIYIYRKFWKKVLISIYKVLHRIEELLMSFLVAIICLICCVGVRKCLRAWGKRIAKRKLKQARARGAEQDKLRRKIEEMKSRGDAKEEELENLMEELEDIEEEQEREEEEELQAVKDIVEEVEEDVLREEEVELEQKLIEADERQKTKKIKFARVKMKLKKYVKQLCQEHRRAKMINFSITSFTENFGKQELHDTPEEDPARARAFESLRTATVAFVAQEGTNGTATTLAKQFKLILETISSPYTVEEQALINNTKQAMNQFKSLDKARSIVDKITKAEISVLKSYSRPPSDVLKVMLGVYILLGHPPDDVDEWSEVKRELKLLGKKGTLNRIKNRRIKDISQKRAKQARKYLAHIEKPDKLDAVCHAANVLYSWAMSALAESDKHVIDRASTITVA